MNAPLRPEEALLNYPFPNIPNAGELFQVTEGIFWIRMPLPFALDHINLWLLADEVDGKPSWTIIDCGVGLPPTRKAWEHIFAEHLQGIPVGRVIITHAHPDHIGNAGWIRARFGGEECRFMASAGEILWAMIMHNNKVPGYGIDAQAEHFRKHGIQMALLNQVRAGREYYYPGLVPDVPQSFERLVENDTIHIKGKEWRLIVGRGHSMEHISLYCPAHNILISGDMLLPRISTNVGVWPSEPEANPIDAFLKSLDSYAGLPSDVLVLPSHGRIFQGASERVRQLKSHHADRLDETLNACSSPISAADLIPIMFRPNLDPHQMTFALGEALAHLHYLRDAGQVRRHLAEDGIYRFTQ